MFSLGVLVVLWALLWGNVRGSNDGSVGPLTPSEPPFSAEEESLRFLIRATHLTYSTGYVPVCSWKGALYSSLYSGSSDPAYFKGMKSFAVIKESAETFGYRDSCWITIRIPEAPHIKRHFEAALSIFYGYAGEDLKDRLLGVYSEGGASPHELHLEFLGFEDSQVILEALPFSWAGFEALDVAVSDRRGPARPKALDELMPLLDKPLRKRHLAQQWSLCVGGHQMSVLPSVTHLLEFLMTFDFSVVFFKFSAWRRPYTERTPLRAIEVFLRGRRTGGTGYANMESLTNSLLLMAYLDLFKEKPGVFPQIVGFTCTKEAVATFYLEPEVDIQLALRELKFVYFPAVTLQKLLLTPAAHDLGLRRLVQGRRRIEIGAKTKLYTHLSGMLANLQAEPISMQFQGYSPSADCFAAEVQFDVRDLEDILNLILQIFYIIREAQEKAYDGLAVPDLTKEINLTACSQGELRLMIAVDAAKPNALERIQFTRDLLYMMLACFNTGINKIIRICRKGENGLVELKMTTAKNPGWPTVVVREVKTAVSWEMDVKKPSPKKQQPRMKPKAKPRLQCPPVEEPSTANESTDEAVGSFLTPKTVVPAPELLCVEPPRDAAQQAIRAERKRQAKASIFDGLGRCWPSLFLEGEEWLVYFTGENITIPMGDSTKFLEKYFLSLAEKLADNYFDENEVIITLRRQIPSTELESFEIAHGETIKKLPRLLKSITKRPFKPTRIHITRDKVTFHSPVPKSYCDRQNLVHHIRKRLIDQPENPIQHIRERLIEEPEKPASEVLPLERPDDVPKLNSLFHVSPLLEVYGVLWKVMYQADPTANVQCWKVFLKGVTPNYPREFFTKLNDMLPPGYYSKDNQLLEIVRQGRGSVPPERRRMIFYRPQCSYRGMIFDILSKALIYASEQSLDISSIRISFCLLTENSTLVFIFSEMTVDELRAFQSYLDALKPLKK